MPDDRAPDWKALAAFMRALADDRRNKHHTGAAERFEDIARALLRAEAALRFYADVENWKYVKRTLDSTTRATQGGADVQAPARLALGPALADLGRIARQALAGEQQETDHADSLTTIPGAR